MSSESLNYFHTGGFVSYMVYRMYTVTCAFQTEMSWVFAVYKSLKDTLIISDTCKTHQNNLYLKMGKSRLEQCQSTKELKYETILRPLCGNSSELLLFEFTGFLGHVLIYSSARSCWFSVIFDLYGFLGFLSSSNVHLWSTAKLNCLSLRRWTTLAMPGWQATRIAPWMGTPTRAGMTSFWWNSMPRVSTCGRASAVVRAGTMLSPCRRTGCDFVFESFPWRKNMEKL